jgi:hypothetical protein
MESFYLIYLKGSQNVTRPLLLLLVHQNVFHRLAVRIGACDDEMCVAGSRP